MAVETSSSPTSATSPTSRSSRSSSRPATRSPRTTRSSRSSPTRRRWTCRRRSAAWSQELQVKVGDKVSEGTPLLTLEAATAPARRRPTRGSRAGAAAEAARRRAAAIDAEAPPRRPRAGAAGARARARAGGGAARGAEPRRRRPTARSTPAPACAGSRASSASTSRAVKGTGRKGRITKDDVEAVAKGARAAPAAPAAGGGDGAGLGLAAVAEGRLREVRRDRARAAVADPEDLRRRTCARNWVMIPHVTQHDEADITDLEAFRKQINAEHAKEGVKVTMVALLMKAVRRVAEGVPGLQRLARRRRPGPQALLQHRLRRRHAERASSCR